MGTRIGVLVDLLLFYNRIHQHRNEKNMEKNERQNLNRQLAQMLQQLGVETFEIRQLKDWQQPKDGLPVFGTCAGMILLSEGYLGTMDIRVRRNAYGRQLGSFHSVSLVNGIGDNIPMTFIRAPYIKDVLSPKCQILAELGGHVVAARQGNQIATSFHPELDGDLRVHSNFLDMAK